MFILLVAMCIGGLWYLHYKLITNFLDKKSVIFSVLPIEYTFDGYEITKNNPFNILVKINGLKIKPLNNLNPKIAKEFDEYLMTSGNQNSMDLEMSSNIIDINFYIKDTVKELKFDRYKNKEVDFKCEFDKNPERYISYQLKKGITFADLKNLDIKRLMGDYYKISVEDNVMSCSIKNENSYDKEFANVAFSDSEYIFKILDDGKYSLKGSGKAKYDFYPSKFSGVESGLLGPIFTKDYKNNIFNISFETTFEIKPDIDLNKVNGLFDYYNFETVDVNLDYKNDTFEFNIDSKNVLPTSSKNKLQVIDYSKMLESIKNIYIDSLKTEEGKKKYNKLKIDIEKLQLGYDFIIMNYVKYFKSIANSYDDKQISIDIDLDLLNFFNFEKQKVGKVNLAKFIMELSKIDKKLEGNESSNKKN
jgi:hypothetical protein